MFHVKLPNTGQPFKCEEPICENYLCLHCHFVVEYEGDTPKLEFKKKKSKTAVRNRYCLECFIRIKRKLNLEHGIGAYDDEESLRKLAPMKKTMQANYDVATGRITWEALYDRISMDTDRMGSMLIQ